MTTDAEKSSRGMFVARLENMVRNGDTWLTIPAVLALLSDCDMLASREVNSASVPTTEDRIKTEALRIGMQALAAQKDAETNPPEPSQFCGGLAALNQATGGTQP